MVNNVNKVTSSSRADTSEVTLEFAWGTNMDFAALDVRERLDVVRLPLDAEKPVLLRYDPSLDPIVRIGLYGDTDLVRMRLVAEEEVKRSLERIDGVAAVLVSGGLEEEIQVEIDERRLASLGLSVEQVIARLASENINLTGGRLREGQTEYLVRTINEFLRAEDMESIVIDRSQGAIIRLTDVARVYKGHREREIVTRIGGQETVEIAVYKEGGTNTVAVAGAVLEGVEAVRADLAEARSAGCASSASPTRPATSSQSVQEVLDTAIIGGSLAILVLYLFLRSLKTTSIIGISIPVSVVATFFLMYSSGISLNIMSLGGLSLGVGMLVDNSIVVLEAIQRKRQQGMSEIEAARAGASEVGHGGDRLDPDHGLRLRADRVRRRHRRSALRRPGAAVTFSLMVSLAVALTVDPDAGVAPRRPSRERGGA